MFRCCSLDSAPEDPEDIKDILNDFAEHILPMTLFWKHPHFYAYFPGGNSFPNIIGDMLSTTFGGVGFSWVIDFIFLLQFI